MDIAALLTQIGGALGAKAVGGNEGLQQFIANASRMASQQVAMDFEREQRAAQNAAAARDRALQNARSERAQASQQQHQLFMQQREFDQRSREKGLLDSNEARIAANQMSLRAAQDPQFGGTLLRALGSMGHTPPAGAGVEFLGTPEGKAALSSFAQGLGRDTAGFVGELAKDELSRRNNLAKLAGTDVAFKTPATELEPALQDMRGSFVRVTGKANTVRAAFDTLASRTNQLQEDAPNLTSGEARAQLQQIAYDYGQRVAEIEKLRNENPQLFLEGSDLHIRYTDILAESRRTETLITSLGRRINDIHAARTDLSNPESFTGFLPGGGGGTGDLETSMFRSSIAALKNSEQGKRWDAAANLIRGLSESDARELGVHSVRQELLAMDSRRAEAFASMDSFTRGGTNYEQSQPLTIASAMTDLREAVITQRDSYANDPSLSSGMGSGIGIEYTADIAGRLAIDNKQYSRLIRLVKDVNAAGEGDLASKLQRLTAVRGQVAQVSESLVPVREVLGEKFNLDQAGMRGLLMTHGSEGDPSVGSGRVWDKAAMQRFLDSEEFSQILVDTAVGTSYEGVQLESSAVTDLDYMARQLNLSDEAHTRARRLLNTLGFNDVETELYSVPIPEISNPRSARAEISDQIIDAPSVNSNADFLMAGGRAVSTTSLTFWQEDFGRDALGDVADRNALDYIRATKDRQDNVFTAAVRGRDGSFVRAPLYSEKGLGRTFPDNITPYDVANLFSTVTGFGNFVRSLTAADARVGPNPSGPASLPRDENYIGDVGVAEGGIGDLLGVSGGYSGAYKTGDQALLIGAHILDAAREFDLSTAQGIPEPQRDALRHLQRMLRGMDRSQLVEFAIADEGLPFSALNDSIARSRGELIQPADVRLSALAMQDVDQQLQGIDEVLQVIAESPAGSRFDLDATGKVQYTRFSEPMKAIIGQRYQEIKERLQLRKAFGPAAYSVASDVRQTFANIVLRKVHGGAKSASGSFAEEIGESIELFHGQADMLASMGKSPISEQLIPLKASAARGSSMTFEQFAAFMAENAFLLKTQTRSLGMQGSAKEKMMMDKLVSMDLKDVTVELHAVKQAYDENGGYTENIGQMLKEREADVEAFKKLSYIDQVMTLWALKQTASMLPMGMGR